MTKKFNYGGQALLEGVMIRGQESVAISVRRPDGSLSTVSQPLGKFYSGPLRKLPFLRGMVVLVEAMVVGTRSLLYSASVALGEEEETPGALLWGMLALALVFGLALFLVLPLLIVHFLDPYTSPTVNNLIEGFIRAGLLVAYLKAIGLMPDIRRVFAYHGAEHKTVNAYEDNAPLEVDAIRKYSTAHTRCGTSFLLVVVTISILAFALLGRPPLLLRFISRLALVPVIAAVSYELTQLLARHQKSPVARALALPGLALQAMTTREPDKEQLEVALAALTKALVADGIAEVAEKEKATASP